MVAGALLCMSYLLISAEVKDKAVVPGDEGRKAYDDLTSYYEKKIKPPYGKTISDLSSEDATVRKKAGEYIYALLAQLFDDETNGRDVRSRTPFWGGGATSAAREIRKQISKEFGEKAQSAEALKAIEWLIEKEKLPNGPADAVNALRRIKGPESVKVLKKILSEPHPNGAVLVSAIEETAERGLSELAPDVLRLQNSYRDSVRKAVQSAALKLKIENKITEFKPENAFTPWLDQQVKNISAMVLTKVPADAKWMTFEHPNINYRSTPNEKEKAVTDGWLLQENDNEYQVLDVFGQKLIFQKNTTKTSPKTLQEEAKSIIEILGQDPSKSMGKLSSGGGLTGQFEPISVTVPELLIAAWSYERGDKVTAASILFPRIDKMADDRWITWIARDLMAHPYHKRMLEEFSYNRDYAKAVELGEHLSKPVFDEYQYQDRAKKLVAQLKARKDDFKTFVLPTAAEWEKLKSGMSREKQIDYLAKRLRILNCRQMGQPGDVSYLDAQHSVPFSELKTAEDYKKSEVINPYNELTGMKISVKELPALVPFIKDENFMPTFSFWRDFHPGRTLHQVNWAVAGIINSAASSNLVDLGKFQTLDNEGREEYVRKIEQWCKNNAGKTKDELIVSTLKTAKDWGEFSKSMEDAAQSQGCCKLAIPVMVERTKDFPKNKTKIAEMIFNMNSPDTASVARKWMTDPEDGVRFWASLILLQLGDREKMEGLPELKKILDSDNACIWYPQAVDVLIATKKEDAMVLACGIFKNKSFMRNFQFNTAIQSLFLAGRQECLDFLLENLSASSDSQTAYNVAFMLFGWGAPNFDLINLPPNATEEQRAPKRKALAEWLTTQFGAIKRGEPSQIKIKPAKSSSPKGRIDAP